MAATPSCLFTSCCYPLVIVNKHSPSPTIFTTTTYYYRPPFALQYCNNPNGVYNPNLFINKKSTVFPLALALDTQHFQHDDTESDTELDTESEAESEAEEEHKKQLLPCQLYVCNLPSAFDISHLLHLFDTFGTVQSVEVSRDPQTGLSRGCGYVTMSSIHQAKSAISALDGSDVGGRELRVMFSVDVNKGRRNVDALNSSPKRDLIFESPYKLYAGNLTWSIKPEDLRNLFSQFGTVVSARVKQDRKAGKSRVYGFLSFSSPAELEAAMALNGTDYRGRKIVLREVKQSSGLTV
ncbi:28 kDa ribonucleoprotein, chloroplastic [Apium graveolens]|uniref:28 kDa ribonucleoprotein, chloroplastic n=1 Tax=Apium graveolens TaxID=4045 RepID=UPI003D78E0A8